MRALLIVVCLMLASCASNTIDDYLHSTPVINVQEFFQGDLVAYGIVRNRSGKVTRHFRALLKASWAENEQGQMVGTLDETFWFNDGEEQKRVWILTPDNEGGYIGTADDVKESADIVVNGQAMNLLYKLVVPWKDSSITLDMDDWMYSVTPKVVINETQMKKWGFKVGKVTLVIMKAGVTEDIPALLSRVP